MSETSTVDKLSKAANRRLDATTAGTAILTSVIVLSGILSALFFWRHSAAIFSGIPPLLATGMGLAIGLIPSEGAFFGWKRIRATKQDMTKAQMNATRAGLWFAVGFAVANVIAVFISSFSGIPAQVQLLSEWVTFFALMLPIPVQFILYAQFVVNEQSTVENHQQAKLHALAHAAYIKSEEARIEAALRGAEMALEAKLADYGTEVGSAEAARILQDGKRDIIGQYYNGKVTAGNAAAPSNVDPALVAAVIAAMSIPTHNAPRQDAPTIIPVMAQGQGEPNGPPAKLGRDTQNPTSRQ